MMLDLIRLKKFHYFLDHSPDGIIVKDDIDDISLFTNVQSRKSPNIAEFVTILTAPQLLISLLSISKLWGF